MIYVASMIISCMLLKAACFVEDSMKDVFNTLDQNVKLSEDFSIYINSLNCKLKGFLKELKYSETRSDHLLEFYTKSEVFLKKISESESFLQATVNYLSMPFEDLEELLESEEADPSVFDLVSECVHIIHSRDSTVFSGYEFFEQTVQNLNFLIFKENDIQSRWYRENLKSLKREVKSMIRQQTEVDMSLEYARRGPNALADTLRIA